jgi:hypothetical protein
LPLPGLRRLFVCTPSRLAAFDCPRRYRFAYVDKPAPPKGAPWEHNSVGAIAHLALHRWWSLPLAQRTPEAGVVWWSGTGARTGSATVARPLTGGPGRCAGLSAT